MKIIIVCGEKEVTKWEISAESPQIIHLTVIQKKGNQQILAFDKPKCFLNIFLGRI